MALEARISSDMFRNLLEDFGPLASSNVFPPPGHLGVRAYRFGVQVLAVLVVVYILQVLVVLYILQVLAVLYILQVMAVLYLFIYFIVDE